MEKLKRESSKARHGFEDYYALGPDRSLDKLYHRYADDIPNPPTRSLGTLKRWCHSFDWPERVRERDRKAVAKTEERVTDAIADMRARQAELGRDLQAKGLERLNALDPEEITTRDAIDMIVKGAELERKARGEEAPVLDISILLADVATKHDQQINIIALSERMMAKALEQRGIKDTQEEGGTDDPIRLSG